MAPLSSHFQFSTSGGKHRSVNNNKSNLTMSPAAATIASTVMDASENALSAQCADLSATLGMLRKANGRDWSPKETRRVKDSIKNLETTLQILASSGDRAASYIQEQLPELIFDLGWMLKALLLAEPVSNVCPQTTLWTLIQLMTSWCSVNSDYIDHFNAPGPLTEALVHHLLVAEPTEEHEIQLLELLAHILIRKRSEMVVAMDALKKLLAKTLQLYQSRENSTILTLSLFLMATICDESREACKFVLASLSFEDRKAFLAKESDDARIKVLLWSLNLSLNSISLTTSIKSNNLEQLCSAFCKAYANDEVLYLELYCRFLEKMLSTLKTTENQVLDSRLASEMLMQPIVGAKFDGDGIWRANEAFFKYIRLILAYHPDPSASLETTLKTVELYLDDERACGHVVEVYHVLGGVGSWLKRNHSSICDSSTDSLLLQNVKLQMEPILGMMATSILAAPAAASRSSLGSVHVRSKCGLVCALTRLAQVADWNELIAGLLKADKLVQLVRQLLEQPHDRTLLLVADIVLLVRELSTWKTDILASITTGLPELQRRFLTRIRSYLCSDDEAEKLLAVLTICQEGNNANEDTKPSGRQAKVDQMEPENEQDEDIVNCEDVQGAYTQRHLDNLKKSLRLSHESNAALMEENKIISLELSRLNIRLLKMSNKYQRAEDMSSSFRTQFATLQEEARLFKESKNKECQSKAAEASQLKSELSAMKERAIRYKETQNALQETIEEYRANQQQMEIRLNAEAKINAELSQSLEKREEKLKKRDQLLEEEQIRREKVESELEILKKEVSSLQTLTKRQEVALNKKEKTIQEQTDELNQVRLIQEQIFNLSKMKK